MHCRNDLVDQPQSFPVILCGLCAGRHDRTIANPPYESASAMSKTAIQTPSAPQAIGTYSQAVRCGDTVYLAGQIGLDPATMQMADDIDAQIHRVFSNLQAVAWMIS